MTQIGIKKSENSSFSGIPQFKIILNKEFWAAFRTDFYDKKPFAFNPNVVHLDKQQIGRNKLRFSR
jgi:hypothetical protein